MTVGYLLSGVLTHLPVLAVLIAGLVLASARKARLGPRSTMFARLGLGALLLSQVLEIVWLIVFPQLISSLDYRASTYGVVTFAVGAVLSLLMAGGVGLLVAAVVTRASDGGGPFAEPSYAFQTPAGQPFSAGSAYQPGAGPPPEYGPAGPPG